MIVDLPNGTQWNNEKDFRGNEPMAQFWFFQTLKMALDKHIEVKRLGIAKNGKDLYYNEIERDGITLSCDNWYKYLGGNWMDVDNWKSAPKTKFTVSPKIED